MARERKRETEVESERRAMVTGDKEMYGSGSINDRASEDVVTGSRLQTADSHRARWSRPSHSQLGTVF